MSNELTNRKVLITQSKDYMGPPIADRFREAGAVVVEASARLSDRSELDRAVQSCPEPDVLVANLAAGPSPSSIADIQDADWDELFDVMVRPLMQLVRAIAPGMVERGGGKIVAITSAAPLRGIPGTSAYCAARGAQNAFVRTAGLELAPGNVQFNAIAQNYIKNKDYYSDELIATERFQNHLQHNVPIGRLAEPRETADLALFMASQQSNFMVGQVIPFAGGWVTSTG